MAIIVGHRGACGYAPENSILSFQAAIDIGCQKTECDVRLSKDQHLVVIHDEGVDRISDGHGLVREMTLKKIQQLRCPGQQKIPTLQEVINVCASKIDLMIELKVEGVARKVIDLISVNKMRDRVTMISFDLKHLKEVKKFDPYIKVGYLFNQYQEDIRQFLQDIPLDYLGPRFDIVTKEMVDLAHEYQVKIYAYHVNEQKMGKNLMHQGVDEIGTDYPKLFL